MPSSISRSERATRLLEALYEYCPDVSTTLDFADDPWRLLVGGILAAQATDKRVNMITPALFERFPSVADFARVEPEDVEPYIKSVGIYRNKARSIVRAARWLMSEEDGQVPDDIDRLLRVPGVGRKIANLVLSDYFGQPAVVVDTHCKRISRLMGLTDSEDPARIERDLQEVLPRESWTDWGHMMVTLGREICIARRPDCEHCPCQPHCRYGSGEELEA